MMAPDGCSKITQPPVLALGLKMVLEKEADDELMAYALPKLAAHLQWIMKNRDTDGNGLVEWNIEGDPMCRSGESGMDNSPRFDAATQLDATDFNSYLSMECEIVAEFAEHLGNKAMAAEWKAHHERMLLWRCIDGCCAKHNHSDLLFGCRFHGMASSSG